MGSFDIFLPEKLRSLKKMLNQEQSLPEVRYGEYPGGIMIEAAFPGFNGKEIEVSVKSRKLILRGIILQESRVCKENYSYHRRYREEFSRSVEIPAGLDISSMKVDRYKGGVLVRLPFRY